MTLANITLAAARENDALLRRTVANIIGIEHEITEDHVTGLSLSTTTVGIDGRAAEAVAVGYEVTLTSTHVEAVHAAFDGLEVGDWNFALQYSAANAAEARTFAYVEALYVDNPTYADVADDDDDDDLSFLSASFAALPKPILFGVLGAAALICVCCAAFAVGRKSAPASPRPGPPAGGSIDNIDFGTAYKKPKEHYSGKYGTKDKGLEMI